MKKFRARERGVALMPEELYMIGYVCFEAWMSGLVSGYFEAWLSGLVSGIVLVVSILRWLEIDKSNEEEDDEND